MLKITENQTIEVRYAFTGWKQETGWLETLPNGDAMFDGGQGRFHLPACNWRPAALEKASGTAYVIKHRCGCTVDYSRFPYWQNPEVGEPPAEWAKMFCDDCMDANHTPARYSVVESRRSSGEWAGDR